MEMGQDTRGVCGTRLIIIFPSMKFSIPIFEIIEHLARVDSIGRMRNVAIYYKIYEIY